ncbi:LexA family transcriptional regulator [Buttiauxella sp. A2-C2_NF]|uniref:XRE family transcriptional regulator n=1 Tax=Buttiauxella ferragutiae TaxID=82989 RepID=UPI001E4393C2|nr:LexA family transcriptional regulator [Buttiauxella ferragutiae]MCE0826588.1 LexA family transcriptional regulator [Buttiauxella ferragutiae]
MTGKKESVVQFSERLKSIVPSGSGREFAKRAGIGYSTVHNYLQAVSSPTLENLVLLAKAGGVSVEWLATGKEFTKSAATDQIERILQVPFIGGEDFLLLDSSTFPDLQEKADDLAVLRVDTDVMAPTFAVGSILLIDQRPKHLKEGQVIVLHKGDSYLYKRVQVVSEGYCLSSDNKKYDAMILKDSSLSLFKVVGEVLSVINPL